MDMQIIRDLFSHCIEATEVLDLDATFRAELKEALDKLPPLKIGKYGQIQEWDEDFDEAEPGHRHVAHMFALHPGEDRKSTRLNSSHVATSYAVFCLKKKQLRRAAPVLFVRLSAVSCSRGSRPR